MERQITTKYTIRKYKLKYLIEQDVFNPMTEEEASNLYLYSDYDWDALEEKLRKEGYSPKKYNYIELEDVSFDQGFKKEVMLIDGRHRLPLLYKIHGEDLEIKVKVEEVDTVDGRKFLKPDGEDKVCPYCMEALKGCNCKLSIAKDGSEVHQACVDNYNKKQEEGKKILAEKIKEFEENGRKGQTQ